MDNFTIAVLAGAAAVIIGFVLMMVFDKKSTSLPSKPAGK
jgi:hypothetical protein